MLHWRRKRKIAFFAEIDAFILFELSRRQWPSRHVQFGRFACPFSRQTLRRAARHKVQHRSRGAAAAFDLGQGVFIVFILFATFALLMLQF